MKIVFVHGINQQGKSSEIISSNWSAAINATTLNSNSFDQFNVQAPFYGDILFNALRSTRTKGNSASIPPKELAFKNSIALEIAKQYNAQLLQTDTELTDIISRSSETDRGFPHNKTFIKVAQTIEKVSPLHGRLALRFLEQAYAYVTDQKIAKLVDDSVRDSLRGTEECVVVAHSLGTLVTYNILRELGTNANVVRYITLGSPLGIRTIRDEMHSNKTQPYPKPSGVSQWYNALDLRDFVALGHKLKAEIYDGITGELSDIQNDKKDHHAITEGGYLTDKRICKWIIPS